MSRVLPTDTISLTGIYVMPEAVGFIEFFLKVQLSLETLS